MSQVCTPWGVEMDQRIALDILQRPYDPTDLPGFSTSWEGMGLVVEHLRQRGSVLLHALGACYLAEVPASNGRDLIQITAETAPLVVCQAALAQRDLVLTDGNYLSVRQALIRRDGLECYYCGEPCRFAVEVESAISALNRTTLTPTEYSSQCTALKRTKMVVGHRIKPALGGTDFIENLVIAHAYCNAVGGAKDL